MIGERRSAAVSGARPVDRRFDVDSTPGSVGPGAAGPGSSPSRAGLRHSVRRTALLLVAAFAALVAVWSAMGLLLRSGPMGGVRGFDDDVARSMVTERTPRMDDVAFYVAHGADTFVKIGATALIALVFWLMWHRWNEVAVVVLSLALEAAVFMTVTLIVQRPRPPVPQLETSPVDSSFPSGHTAAAAVYCALAVVLFWHTRHRVARTVAVVLSVMAPALIGLARVYQGMHHVTDTAAGALLGFTTVAIVTVIIGRPRAEQGGGESGEVPADTRPTGHRRS